MMKVVLECLKLEGAPLNRMILDMKWKEVTLVTPSETAQIESFLAIMSPFEQLFAR